MPIGKDAPDAKLLVTEGVLQLSVAVGAVHVATAFEPAVVRLIFCGQLLITGGVASLAQGSKNVTIILKRHSETLFLASRAV